MNSKKIAIDVVLLPPEEIMDLCIAINKKCAAEGKAKALLGKKDFIPHLSLGIGCVEEKDLPKIKSILKNIAARFAPVKVELHELYHYISKTDSKKAYGFRAKITPEIQHFHETVMRELDNFFSYDTTTEMLYKDQGEVIQVLSPAFTKYKENYGFENYKPHITLMCHEVTFKELPIKFTSSTIVLCHLGDHCTCRKILFSTPLAKR